MSKLKRNSKTSKFRDDDKEAPKDVFVARGSAEEKAQIADLQSQVSSTVLDVTASGGDLSTWLMAQKGNTAKMELDSLNLDYQRRLIMMCGNQLVAAGNTEENIIEGISMFITLYASNPEVRQVLNEDIADKVESFGNMIPFGGKLAQAARNYKEGIDRGYTPYTAESAAVTSVALDRSYYEALRQPGVDTEQLSQDYSAAQDQLGALCERDGVAINDVHASKLIIIGKLSRDNSEVARAYEGFAQNVYTEAVNAEGEWSGHYHSKLTDTVVTPRLTVRAPSKPAEIDVLMSKAVDRYKSQGGTEMEALSIVNRVNYSTVNGAYIEENFDPSKLDIENGLDAKGLELLRETQSLYDITHDDGYSDKFQKLSIAGFSRSCVRDASKNGFNHRLETVGIPESKLAMAYAKEMYMAELNLEPEQIGEVRKTAFDSATKLGSFSDIDKDVCSNLMDTYAKQMQIMALSGMSSEEVFARIDSGERESLDPYVKGDRDRVRMLSESRVDASRVGSVLDKYIKDKNIERDIDCDLETMSSASRRITKTDKNPDGTNMSNAELATFAERILDLETSIKLDELSESIKKETGIDINSEFDNYVRTIESRGTLDEIVKDGGYGL